MKLSWEQIIEAALDHISEEERPQSAIYLDRRVVPKDEPLEVDRKTIPSPFDAAVVFIDLAPALNWGHACAYLLIDVDSGDLEQIDAEFPPFFKSVSPTLELLAKGEEVPEWTIVMPD